ncbi:MAG TPA: SIS domain-containing protein, partial [Reyranella sp.]|nr:SIS domain-containing protein [Reyranella sp.]
MSKFPSRKYANVGAFVADYAELTAAALKSVRPSEIERAVATLKRAIAGDKLIFACGNGGSAAIANDIDYGEVFTHQLRNAARPGDVLITISSSGDSENIVRALAWARDNGMTTIAMSGFSGGRSAPTADISLH